MPNKLADELRTQSDEDMSRQVNETQRDLFNLRFRLATRQLENSHALRLARKKLARLKTLQTERRIAASLRESGAQPDNRQS
jgi:large subunit ribosomal protein L29